MSDNADQTLARIFRAYPEGSVTIVHSDTPLPHYRVRVGAVEGDSIRHEGVGVTRRAALMDAAKGLAAPAKRTRKPKPVAESTTMVEALPVAEGTIERLDDLKEAFEES